MVRRLLPLLLVLTPIAVLALACSDDGGSSTPTDTGGDGDAAPDSADGGDLIDELPPGTPRWTQPNGHASLVLTVDDTANQTYLGAQMEWNGSFAYDAASNTIVFASSWLPDQGPFPPLYDDGPYTDGGHEAESATAGDHRFEVEVFFLADEATTFEYGLINELDDWIWLGPNGTVDVDASETGTVEAPGLTFERFGQADLRIQLDTSALHAEFSTIDPQNDAVFVKGSMNSWRPVQLLDNGARGDASADDGVFTFTLSEYLGAHDGLLRLGQEAQFVFVFFDARGTEYKLNGNALTNGVSAFTTWQGGGVFEPEELLLRSESAGRSLNTAILVGPDENPIVDPVLRFVDPARGPTTGATPVELSGEGFQVGATITIGGVATTCVVQSDRIINCTTPPRAGAGVVGVTVTNPDGGSDTHQLGFTYVDVGSSPRIDSIVPPEGSELGSTPVTLNGANFQVGASVTFGGELASDVNVTSASQLIAVTPAHIRGPVDVTVRNPDTQTVTLRAGYTYRVEGVDWAALQWPTSTIAVGLDETLPELFAVAYEPGVTDSEGAGGGLSAELLIGPPGGDPSLDFSGWTAYALEYHGDLGNNDEYTQAEALSFGEAGEYAWAARFSLDGGTNWFWADYDTARADYDPAAAGTIVVTDGLVVRQIEPQAVSLLGSSELVVTGSSFSASTSALGRPFAAPPVEFGALATTFDATTQLTLGLGSGPRQVGRWDLRFEDGDDVALIANAYLVGYVWTPVVDGTIAETPADWDPAFLHATSAIDTNWTGNELLALYASFDDAGLYLGLSANLQRQGVEADPGNVLVVYLDTDFGAASGFSNMAAIGDEDTDVPPSFWRLDRALTSPLDAGAISGFGADFAVGSFDLAPTAAANYVDALSGWRQLRSGDNAWYPLDTDCDPGPCLAGTNSGAGAPGALETFVPWTILYGAEGVPLGGRRVALFARIVNRTGDFISNQSLPEEPDDEDPWNVTDVVVLEVR